MNAEYICVGCIIISLQSNQVYYTDSGKECMSKCDWSMVPSSSSYSLDCLDVNGSRHPCSPFKSIIKSHICYHMFHQELIGQLSLPRRMF